jgi:hypothetical protein
MKTVSRRCGFFSMALVCVAALGLVISGCPMDGSASQVTVSSVTVSPANPAVTAGETLTFSALVSGTNNPPQTVTWSVEGGVEGTAITSGGVLSVAAGETASALTVRAVSTFDTTKSGRANVTVSAAKPDPEPEPEPEPKPDPENEPEPEPEPESEALAGFVSITGTAIVGESLTVNESGLTNKIGAPSYQWQRDGGIIADATAASYTLVQDDAGHAITVVVSYSGNLGSVTSAPTAAVVAAEEEKQALAGMVQITGTAKVGQNLTVNDGGLTNKLGAPSYQWQRDGGTIADATAASYTLVQDDAGHAITVVVSYSGNTGSVTSAATGAVELRELGGTVSINGDTRVGQQLTVDESGLLYQAGTPAYQWKKNATDIAGANSAAYLIKTADLGATITVVVSYSGNAGNVTSAATAAVGKQLLTGSILITGVAKKGNVLTANISGGNGTGTAAYQWMRGTNDITGANDATYTLVADDVGHAIKVRASYADKDGSITSNPTATVDIVKNFTITFNYADGGRTVTIADNRTGVNMETLEDLNIINKFQNAATHIVSYNEMDAFVVHMHIKNVLDDGVTIMVLDSVPGDLQIIDRRTIYVDKLALSSASVVELGDGLQGFLSNIMYPMPIAIKTTNTFRLANNDGSAGVPGALFLDKFLSKGNS